MRHSHWWLGKRALKHEPQPVDKHTEHGSLDEDGREVGSIKRWSFHRPEGGEHPVGYLLLLFRVKAEEGELVDRHWVGFCDELDTSSFGTTPEEALEATLEATELYLNALEELGTADKFLADRGLTIDLMEPDHAAQVDMMPGDMAFVSPQRLVRVGDC